MIYVYSAIALVVWFAVLIVSFAAILSGWDDGKWKLCGIGIVGLILALAALLAVISDDGGPYRGPYCPRACRYTVRSVMPVGKAVMPTTSEHCDWACARKLDEQ